MIPSVRDDLQNDFEIETVRFPSKSYNLLVEKSRCIGFVDGIEAIKQAIFLMLSIERYEHVIYSWNYGVEFKDLFGQPTDYVASEVKRRIRECLLQDDRINEVDSFEVTTKKNKVHVSFTAHTIYGEVQAEKEVAI